MQEVNHPLNALFVTTCTSGCQRILCLILFFYSSTHCLSYKEPPVWKEQARVGRACRYEGNIMIFSPLGHFKQEVKVKRRIGRFMIYCTAVSSESSGQLIHT